MSYQHRAQMIHTHTGFQKSQVSSSKNELCLPDITQSLPKHQLSLSRPQSKSLAIKPSRSKGGGPYQQGERLLVVGNQKVQETRALGGSIKHFSQKAALLGQEYEQLTQTPLRMKKQSVQKLERLNIQQNLEPKNEVRFAENQQKKQQVLEPVEGQQIFKTNNMKSTFFNVVMTQLSPIRQTSDLGPRGSLDIPQGQRDCVTHQVFKRNFKAKTSAQEAKSSDNPPHHRKNSLSNDSSSFKGLIDNDLGEVFNRRTPPQLESKSDLDYQEQPLERRYSPMSKTKSGPIKLNSLKQYHSEGQQQQQDLDSKEEEKAPSDRQYAISTGGNQCADMDYLHSQLIGIEEEDPQDEDDDGDDDCCDEEGDGIEGLNEEDEIDMEEGASSGSEDEKLAGGDKGKQIRNQLKLSQQQKQNSSGKPPGMLKPVKVQSQGKGGQTGPQFKIKIQNKKVNSLKQQSSQKHNGNVNQISTPSQNKAKAEKVQQSQSKQSSNQNSQPKKKKNNKQVALIHSLPKNLDEEMSRFFENNCTINPVFEYENPSLAFKYLQQFKQPNDEYMQVARLILDDFLQYYQSETNYLVSEGEILTQEETEKYFMDYLEELGIQEQLTLCFSRNKVAPTSVTHDPKSGKSRINIGLPIEYRRGRIVGVLHHEIGTHFLRKYNEKQQVWYKKREKYELRNCIQTEEGFAAINQAFEMVQAQDRVKKPFLYKGALNYYSAYMASKMSFVELYNDLEKFIDNPRRRFKCVCRVKRGLIDTSEPGGLYKDQVYLEGAIQILRERKNIDFIGLYCGKLSLDDLRRQNIEKRLRKENILLPKFMENLEEYMRTLDVIAEVNHVE